MTHMVGICLNISGWEITKRKLSKIFKKLFIPIHTLVYFLWLHFSYLKTVFIFRLINKHNSVEGHTTI